MFHDKLVTFALLVLFIDSLIAGSSVTILALNPKRENARYYLLVAAFTLGLALAALFILLAEARSGG